MDIIATKKMPIASRTHQFDEMTYTVDGLKVKALQMCPLKKAVNRIVVYLRGGKGQVGRVRAARLMQFANDDTLVIGPYYRGSNGSEGRDEFANADLKDVTYLIRILKQRYPNAYVHMIGFSRGGIQGLLTYQDYPVDSYIIWGGVSDMHLMYEERVDLRGMLRRMVGHPDKHKDAYDKRDAIKLIDAHSPPILIVHGGKDKQVGIHHAYYLEKQLSSKGVDFDTFYQIDEGHVPRPPAMKKALNYVHHWMSKCEGK
ncbi:MULTISPECIES: S9 family peptidase [unclassified Staphylococcus]|uniref:alpha/beta hydrolase family protein n=1 Tax=unclassified Staphylococcus TaxID=91994 RepID=UPI001880A614|nr:MULTISPECIES: prolyl oligopeptidase family serine peptidase [unclassified Staphylococcus]MBF2757751.1 S9 family peptidase [Staphylococcus haemolyticus]MBF2773369.1 S9 family peptidase [Staphylococcus haemolyticus]MBF2776948.1 S9 family peptidase [Staphylococcus haemolyticus]MBF2815201.1 S9 family peptidase [Staphylococcus haemolyticus]MBF9721764.1 S9 family peptidase [Staphylococcus haemolyticus]